MKGYKLYLNRGNFPAVFAGRIKAAVRSADGGLLYVETEEDSRIKVYSADVNHQNKIAFLREYCIIRPEKEKPMTSPENRDLLLTLLESRGVRTAALQSDFRSALRICKIPAGMDLKVGDQVLAPGEGALESFKTYTVKILHDRPAFDLDSTDTYPWIAQKLDLAPFFALVAEEKRLLEEFRRAAAFERMKRVAESAGINLNDIKTPLLDGPKQ